jgi:hypothetical protein
MIGNGSKQQIEGPIAGHFTALVLCDTTTTEPYLQPGGGEGAAAAGRTQLEYWAAGSFRAD